MFEDVDGSGGIADTTVGKPWARSVRRRGNLYGWTEKKEDVVGSFCGIEGFLVSAVPYRDKLKRCLETMCPSNKERVNGER